MSPLNLWRLALAWYHLARVSAARRSKGLPGIISILHSLPAGAATRPDSAIVTKSVRATASAAALSFGHPMCLDRSAALVCLLRSSGVTAELVIAAQRMPFAAHAWVEVQGQAVNEIHENTRDLSVLERF
jgi:hypothetical protein